MALRPPRGKSVDKTLPDVIVWQPGQTLPAFDLPTNLLLQSITFQLTVIGNHAGYNAAVPVRKEGLENLISSVRFIGQRKGSGVQDPTMSYIDPAYLRFKQRFFSGTDVDRVDVPTANGDFEAYTTFTKSFGAVGIPQVFANCFVDTRLYSRFQVQLNTRTVAALVAPGGAGTTTITSAYITVHIKGWEDAGIVAGAPFVRETMQQIDINSSLPVLDAIPLKNNLPSGQIISRITFKGTVGDVDYADPSDAFFASALRKEGARLNVDVIGNRATKTVLETTYDHLTADNKSASHLTDFPVGYAMWNTSRNGDLADTLNMAGLQGQIRGDFTPVPNETNTLWIYVEELVKGNSA